MIEFLEWDSNFFGYKIGKFEYSNEISIDKLFKTDYRLIYLISENEITNLGENLVDKKAIFCQQLTKKRNIDFGEIIVKEFEPNINSYSELLELSYNSGTYSRFYTDKNFKNNEFQKLYKKWIDNSLHGKTNYKVFVAQTGENELLGFITLGEKKEGLNDIGLLAVHPKSRGKKIGTKLIEFAKDYSLKNEISQIQVVTQLQNKPATKLYESTGFLLKELNYIYHIWNHDTI